MVFRWFLDGFGPFESRRHRGDVGGLCVGLRSVSARTEQQDVQVTTKSADNVFCTVYISVQFTVNPQQCEDALLDVSKTRRFEAFWRAFGAFLLLRNEDLQAGTCL